METTGTKSLMGDMIHLTLQRSEAVDFIKYMKSCSTQNYATKEFFAKITYLIDSQLAKPATEPDESKKQLDIYP